MYKKFLKDLSGHGKRMGKSVVNGKKEKGLMLGWSFQKRDWKVAFP